jgi:hypothetical protein
MAKFISVIIVFFITFSVFADCASTGITMFPTNSSIKQNSIFMIEGYASSQQIILELGKKHQIYLKNGDNKIKLIVSEVCVGQFLLTQAILKAETEPIAGLEYTVCIDGLPEYETLNRYNAKTGKREAIKYKILAEKDEIAPKMNQKPKEIEKSFVPFGCGPEIYVIFDNRISDNSELLAKTSLKNKSTGKETTYYIPVAGNEISIGHGMCSGAFIFDEGKEFEIEFSFMDASGNLTNWIGERISFTKPEE